MFPLQANEMFFLGQISTRKDNTILLNMILQGRLEDNQALVQGICLREDFFLDSLLIGLSVPHKNRLQNEHFLRIILFSFFNKPEDPGIIAERIYTNRTGLLHLLENVKHFRNPLLKAELFKLCKFLPASTYASLLMEELQRIINLYQNSREKKNLNPEQASLVETILMAIENSGDSLFIDPLGRILPYIGNKKLVKQMRTTILNLLS